MPAVINRQIVNDSLISAAAGNRMVTHSQTSGRHSSAVGKALPSLNTVLRILVFQTTTSPYIYFFNADMQAVNDINFFLIFYKNLLRLQPKNRRDNGMTATDHHVGHTNESKKNLVPGGWE